MVGALGARQPGEQAGTSGDNPLPWLNQFRGRQSGPEQTDHVGLLRGRTGIQIDSDDLDTSLGTGPFHPPDSGDYRALIHLDRNLGIGPCA